MIDRKFIKEVDLIGAALIAAKKKNKLEEVQKILEPFSNNFGFHY